jgi:hypothetical protein
LDASRSDSSLGQDRETADTEGAHVNNEQLMKFPENIPKIFDAKGHAVMDYVTAGMFFALGFAFRGRHDRASTLAFVNGASVLMLSMLTDYPGGIWRTLSFKTHRTVDMLQAGMSALGPTLLGFAGDPEAQAFHGQALLESGVIAATDWDAVAA